MARFGQLRLVTGLGAGAVAVASAAPTASNVHISAGGAFFLGLWYLVPAAVYFYGSRNPRYALALGLPTAIYCWMLVDMATAAQTRSLCALIFVLIAPVWALFWQALFMVPFALAALGRGLRVVWKKTAH